MVTNIFQSHNCSTLFSVHSYALDLNDLLNMELIFRLIGKPFSPGPLPHHACQIIFFSWLVFKNQDIIRDLSNHAC